MSYQQLKKKTEGFTIIEVLIVLAIAGLIMLIVFLAVPNLQRNNRNTQRSATASSILGAISEFQSNNNGQSPTTINVTNGTATISGAASTNPVTVGVTGVFSSYPALVARPGSPATPNADTLQIYSNATCNGAITAAGTSSRQVVAYFGIEDSGTRCIQI